jgi:hypothetical protein
VNFYLLNAFDSGIILSAVKGKSLRDGLRPPLTAARSDAKKIGIEKIKICQWPASLRSRKSVTHVPERLSPMCPV